jgi:hypothetical protein
MMKYAVSNTCMWLSSHKLREALEFGFDERSCMLWHPIRRSDNVGLESYDFKAKPCLM